MISYIEDVPLRNTTAWNAYRNDDLIPHRYGETVGYCLQYDERRLVWVWADHPVMDISEVFVDGIKTGAWEWSNAPDSTGRVVAFIRLQEPPKSGSRITARGKGKMHPTLGGLMENPADIIEDLIVGIAGRGMDAGKLGEFRSACERLGYQASGVLDQRVSLQSAIREICESYGASFAADSQNLCWLNGDELGESTRSFSGHTIFSAESNVEDLVNDLTIKYGYEDGVPKGTVRLECVDSVNRHRMRSLELSARWLSNSRTAVAVGNRFLSIRARPLWKISSEAVSGEVLAGQVVDLSVPLVGFSGKVQLLEREYDVVNDMTTFAFVVNVGDGPVITLVNQSQRVGIVNPATIGVAVVGDQRVIVLKEETGEPIVGASVTLNGQITRTTDASGKVEFPSALMPPGEHTLFIQTVDGRRLTQIVTV